jgi:uncharacterized protein DUF1259
MSGFQSICLAGVLAAGFSSPLTAQTPAPFRETAAVESALGRKGAPQPDGVLKFSFPRSDLSVTVGGVVVKPGLALGSWLGFASMGDGEAMVMGDLVLIESEVENVMLALQKAGIEQTALHHHVINESPRILYMHIRGHGDPAKLAAAIRTGLAQSRTPLGPVAAPSAPAAAIDLDTAGIAAALGRSGKTNGGIYQVAVPRSEAIHDAGWLVPVSMGIATSLNFQPTGAGKAAITGDFVLRANEVNPVLRALRDHGIAVTAIHSHMLDEEPRLFFMHFWANDDAVTLARGLRAALDQTKSKVP